MGLFFRKSKGLGPIRLNFSKSGVGVSTGVKGARLVFSPKGTYVHLGRHGVYYRKKISFEQESSERNTDRPQQETSYATNEATNIETINFNNLTDIDSQEFISELEKKDKLVSFTSMFKFLSIILVIAFFIYFFVPHEKTTTLEKVAIIDNQDVNIRSRNNTQSDIIYKSKKGEEFVVLSDTIKDWIQVKVQEQVGFIYSTLVKFEENEKVTNLPSKLYSSPTLTYSASFALLIFIVLGFIFSKRVDTKRKTMEIYYDLDNEMNEVYDKFISSFESFSKVKQVWYINSKSNVRDFKYHAGANELVKRNKVASISLDKKPLKYLVTNAPIPSIDLNSVKLYFFPERLLIKKGKKYAGLMYSNINIQINDTRFIEEEQVYRDSEIIDYTWKYVNKNGSPDKRFSNNKKIPICRYTLFHLDSIDGLNEIIMTSKPDGMTDFVNLINEISLMQTNKNDDMTDYESFDNEKLEEKMQEYYQQDYYNLLELLQENDEISISKVQVKLLVGYSRGKRIIEFLLQKNIISKKTNGNFQVHKAKMIENKTDIEKHFA